MRTLVRAFVAVCVLAGSVPAASAFTTEEAHCRDVVAQAVERYAAAVTSAVVRCNQRRSSGEAPLETNCYDPLEMDFDGELLLAREEQKTALFDGCLGAESLLLTVYTACPPPAETADDLGLTTGIDDFLEVGDCALALTEAHFLEILEDAQGTPDSVLLKPLWRCQRKLGNGTSRLATTRLAESRRCQELEDFAGSTAFYACADVDARDRIARATARYERRIPPSCATLDPGIEALDACSSDMTQIMGCTEASADLHGEALIRNAYAFTDETATTTTTTTTTMLP